MNQGTIIITGGSGQLGLSLKKYFIKNKLPKYLLQYNFIFFNKREFNITNIKNIEKKIKKLKPKYIINAAAYTNVIEAEKNPQKAYSVNSDGVKNLSILSQKYNFFILHISTELVYEGALKSKKINENSILNPSTVYGKSKLQGENNLVNNCTNFVILRVSWLYSLNSLNFLNYILKQLNNEFFKMIHDAKSSPTSCDNLVDAIIKIFGNKKFFKNKMIFNFCDNGQSVSPYNFTEYILKNLKIMGYSVPKLYKIDFNKYNNSIKKPKFLTLDNTFIKNHINFTPKSWRYEIKRLLKQL